MLSVLGFGYRHAHPHEHLVFGKPNPTPSATRSQASPSPGATLDACPATYREPYAYRPVMSLTFTLSQDFSTVTGHEQLTFVPDLPINEVYLRMWPNAPESTVNGAQMTITAASLQGQSVTPQLSQSSTLVRLPLVKPVTGTATAVAVTTDFTFRLPHAGNDRFGYQPGLAWWGTGFPLLAYEPRHGWALEPPTSAFAETATSQDMSVQLAVTAPSLDNEVIANGLSGQRTGATWSFSASSVRDVAVVVGSFTKALGFAATGVPIQAYVAKGVTDIASQYVLDQTAAVNDHVHRLGPFPYPRLQSVTLPGVRGGIEYPGLIMYGANQHNATPSHEVAHQWFYGLVGNDQARDPWLDESLATFIEALHRNHDYTTVAVPSAGLDKVGQPMSYWEPRTSTYFTSVYLQGADALIKARNAVGATAFDAALRCYVTSHAHQIATPGDFAGAFRELPAVIRTLREVGALR